jgi:hypothetical protein
LDEFASSAGRPEFHGKYASDEIIGNPLQVFQLLKRMTINWDAIRDKMNMGEWKSENCVT